MLYTLHLFLVFHLFLTAVIECVVCMIVNLLQIREERLIKFKKPAKNHR